MRLRVEGACASIASTTEVPWRVEETSIEVMAAGSLLGETPSETEARRGTGRELPLKRPRKANPTLSPWLPGKIYSITLKLKIIFNNEA